MLTRISYFRNHLRCAVLDRAFVKPGQDSSLAAGFCAMRVVSHWKRVEDEFRAVIDNYNYDNALSPLFIRRIVTLRKKLNEADHSVGFERAL